VQLPRDSAIRKAVANIVAALADLLQVRAAVGRGDR